MLKSSRPKWPRGQNFGLPGQNFGLPAKVLASVSAWKLWPRPRPWSQTFGLGLASVCSAAEEPAADWAKKRRTNRLLCLPTIYRASHITVSWCSISLQNNFIAASLSSKINHSTQQPRYHNQQTQRWLSTAAARLQSCLLCTSEFCSSWEFKISFSECMGSSCQHVQQIVECYSCSSVTGVS